MVAVHLKVFVAVCTAVAVAPTTRSIAQQTPPIPVGADAYLMWDHWADQRIGMRAYMRSTYERSGGNDDASNFLYQLSNTRNVTLDVAGPGILYFARYNHWHGSPWRYEVDGAETLVGETSSADPAHPVADSTFFPQDAFPAPLALTWSQTKGADLSWVPIGFQRSFRMAYSRTFYGTGYYIFDQFVGGARLSRPIPTWTARTAPDPAIAKLLGRAGSDIAPPPGTTGVREDRGRLQLSGTAATEVWRSARGPTTIRALEFSAPRSEALALSRVRLRVTWDGRSEPSIDAPLSLFYGAGVLYNRDDREYLVKSLPLVIRYDRERVYLSCYFPMPFFRSARIELLPAAGAEPADISWAVRYAPYTGPANAVGYFHATYRDIPKPVPGQDMDLLNTRAVEGGGDWSGSFVGTSFVFSHDANLTTLEGDPRFFFDDSQTPQGQGTGTEEWAGGGDYWGGENMTLPLAGHPQGARSAQLAKTPEDRIESAYRFLLADLMPFGKNALIRLEHGALNDSAEHYETVAYWYGLPAASLIKTDELAIGDATSEQGHRYVSPTASAPYTIESRYERGVDQLNGQEVYPATTDQGRTQTGDSEFTLRIDPRNVGVMLRRKLDYAYPNQCAEIFVEDSTAGRSRWRSAGAWYTAGSTTSVRSYGGALRVFRPLQDLLRQASTVQGDLTATIPAAGPPLFLTQATALFAKHRSNMSPALEPELTQLQASTRAFLALRAAQGAAPDDPDLTAYAKALEAALAARIAFGFGQDLRQSVETGRTEHFVTTSNRRFRDDEFLLPRALTQGRSTIRIRVRFTPVNLALFPGAPAFSSAWSEMRYAAYSFVVPDFKPPAADGR